MNQLNTPSWLTIGLEAEVHNEEEGWHNIKVVSYSVTTVIAHYTDDGSPAFEFRLNQIRPRDRASSYYTDWLKEGTPILVFCFYEQDGGWEERICHGWDGKQVLIKSKLVPDKIWSEELHLVKATNFVDSKIALEPHRHHCPKCNYPLGVDFSQITT